MKNLSRQGLTHEQIYNALHSKDGSKNIKFRYDLIRHGVKHSEVDVLSASVSFNQSNDINRTARFDIVDSGSIDWLNDMIKPYLLLKVQKEFKYEVVNWTYFNRGKLNWKQRHAMRLSWRKIHNKRYNIKDVHTWVEFPMGVFIPSTPTKNIEASMNVYSVEAYDKTVILKEDCIVDRLFIAKGTNYINAIKSILISANIGDAVNDTVDTVLPTDREFEIGESKLSIINKLLSEINFNPIYTNADGMFVLQKYVEPTESNITYAYKDDDLSVICDEMQSESDYYNVPNVFIAVCSNPELNQDMKSVFINDNPTSKLSTVSRKRNIVSEIYRPDVIASQTDLDEYIRKIAFDKQYE